LPDGTSQTNHYPKGLALIEPVFPDCDGGSDLSPESAAERGKPAMNCGHEDASWPIEDDLLCSGCLLKLLLRMEEEDALFGELATEVIQ
jgi:hypothetical protein